MSPVVEPADLLARPLLFTPAEPGRPTALLASHCAGCGRTAFPRASRCLACGSCAEAVELAGPAEIDVRTAVLSQPPGALINAPYEVGVARFAEQRICVIGLLDGPVFAGDQVRVVVIEPHPQVRTFAFRACTSKDNDEE